MVGVVSSLSTAAGAACVARLPAPLVASSAGTGVQVTGEFAGRVEMSGDVLKLTLDRARVQYSGVAAGDSNIMEDVTLRAVVATDSAGHGIPLGVSAALQVADVLRAGEVRDFSGATMALPLPPGVAQRELWLAFQVRGVTRPPGREPELVIVYTCSAINLFGPTRSASARARRMQRDYPTGCGL